MDNQLILALVDALVEDAIKKIHVPEGAPGPRGLRGLDGNHFNLEEHREEITNLVLQHIPTKIELTDEQRAELRGLDGKNGRNGIDGKDFIFEDHKELITEILQKHSLKFEDLTEEQLATLKGAAGKNGRNGIDGQDFIFEDHRELITEIIQKHSLKFEDLSDSQVESLKGADGKDGKDGKNFDVFLNIELLRDAVNNTVEDIRDSLKLKFEDLSDEEKGQLRGSRGQKGRDGASFHFEDNIESITEILKKEIENKTESLKLKFEDLSDEHKDQLRGSRGQRGKSGKDFSLEESKSFIDETLKKVFSDSAPDLKIKFEDLSHEEKDGLKLKFDDLTFEDRQNIKGPRGQRGKSGRDGDKGDTGEKGSLGPRGPVGARGPIGLRGEKGFEGRDGFNGKDGKDAPTITDVSVEQPTKNSLQFVLTTSDGKEFLSNEVTLPKTQVSNYYSTSGGGGSDSSGSADPTEYFEEGVSIGTAEKLNFIGASVTAVKVGDTVNVTIVPTPGPAGADGIDGVDGTNGTNGTNGTDGADGADGTGSAISISDEYTEITNAATSINFIGDYVRVRPRVAMTDWNPLSDVEPSLSDFDGAGNPGEVDVYIDVPDSSIVKNVTCESDVYIGSFVIINNFEVAVNALADSYATSNVIGIVESKASSTVCDIRVSGVSAEIFSALDSSLEYYLSNTVPGGYSSTIPSTSGHVKLKLGQSFGTTKFLFNKGDRVVRL